MYAIRSYYGAELVAGADDRPVVVRVGDRVEDDDQRVPALLEVGDEFLDARLVRGAAVSYNFV